MGPRELIIYSDTNQMKKDLKADSIQIGLFLPTDFNKRMVRKEPAPVTAYYNATDMGMKDRVEVYLEAITSLAIQERYLEMELDASELQPINVTYQNIASGKEMIGKLAGGFLPYIFIAFGFLGCMYPAIDLFTGEKERGTIETLLTTPVKRWQILFGKMGVVVLSGVLAAYLRPTRSISIDRSIRLGKKSRTLEYYSRNTESNLYFNVVRFAFSAHSFLRRNNDSNCGVCEEFQGSAKYYHSTQHHNGTSCNGRFLPRN